MNVFYEHKITNKVLKLEALNFIFLIIFIIISLFLIFVVKYYIEIISRIRNDINISNTSLLNKIDENLQKSVLYQV